MNTPFRIAVLNSHPIQYFAPLYAYLNSDPSLEITALYCSNVSLRGAIDPGFGKAVQWDVDLLSGYRVVFLGESSGHRTPRGFWSLVCPEVWNEVRSRRYDAVIIHGHAYLVNLIAFVAAKSVGVPVLMRSETHSGLKGRRWRRILRDEILATAYRLVDGFLAIGTANKEYYRTLGVPVSKIFDVPYSVDNRRFMGQSHLTPERRAAIRRAYGLPVDGKIVLFASKFTSRKHPHTLLQAIARLQRQGVTATVCMVGAGELEQQLRDLSRSLSLPSVVFPGFINQSALPEIYAAADIFVLPSENEPWGLIVNEVMCAGLPVIVSSEVGCVSDLVKHGHNGLQVTAGDVDTLAAALEKLLLDDAKRREMGAASIATIAAWGYEQCRVGMLSAAEYLRKAQPAQ